VLADPEPDSDEAALRDIFVDLVIQGEHTWLSALFTTGHAVLLDLTGIVSSDTPLPPRLDLVRATCATDLALAAILLRPDGYVCWAADNPTTARTTLLPAVAEYLAPPTPPAHLPTRQAQATATE
jgi:hypothetical protein